MNAFRGEAMRNPTRRRSIVLTSTWILALLTGLIVSVGTAPRASAELWQSVPNPFPCDSASNACVAHTGFLPTNAYWGQFTNSKGNCTNYAAYRLQTNGAPRLSGSGDAISWRQRVINQYGAGAVNGTPAVGSIAWWGTKAGPSGHVAYVEKVEGSTIYISESVWDYGSRRRVLTPGTAAYPDAFLHMKDAPTGSPHGSPFDDLSSPANGKIRVRGWALDPDAMSTSIGVHIYVGGPAGSGAPGYAYTASVSRPDVANAYPGAGDRHGFDATIDIGKGGTFPVFVYAINAAGSSGGNTLLGSRNVTVGNPVPVGTFDNLRSPEPGKVRVTGWAFDPDAKTQSLRIHAYLGAPVGTPGAEFHDLGVANVSRPDVAQVHAGVGKNQGFDVTISTSKTGNVPVHLYAINAPGTSGSNPQIGARTVAVRDAHPHGSLDAATTPHGGRVNVAGWAIDPNLPTSPIDVHVYIGGPAGTPGAESHSVKAGQARADVGAVHPGTGTHHGFNASLLTKKRGTHAVYVYAINAGPGANRLLGQKAVTIAEPLPISNKAKPRVAGKPQVGKTLKAKAGSWSPGDLTYRYQWRVGSKSIKGANSPKFKVTKRYRGDRVSVVVTASRIGYASQTVASARTGRIK